MVAGRHRGLSTSGDIINGGTPFRVLPKPTCNLLTSPLGPLSMS